MRASKQEIEARLGRPVEAFAYPNGDHDQRARLAVAGAGYKWACTTREGTCRRRDDPFTLRRISVSEASSRGLGGRFSRAVFAVHVSGIFQAIKRFLGGLGGQG